LISRVTDKTSIHLHQDYTEWAVICFKEDIAKEFKITELQQQEYFIYYLIISGLAGVQSLMIF
jgi:hypothetical protein